MSNVSRTDIIRKKRQQGTVGFHKFVLKFKPKHNIPYCFVEGKDDSKYYFPRLVTMCKTEPEFIKCNGKVGLLEAYKEIIKHNEYKTKCLLFFVDSDFDKPINHKDIYETPCYSIENFYTSSNVFERILKNEFNLEESEDDYKIAMDYFIQRQSDFHDAIGLLNAWIYTYKKFIENTGECIKLQLNNLSLKEHLVEISLDSITCKYNLKSIQDYLNVPMKVSDEDIMENYRNMINTTNRGNDYRGKFELDFFKIFLDKLIEDRNKKENRKVFKNKSKISLPLDVNILTVLSIYADTPKSLYDYIEEKWNKSLQLVISSA